ncbi:PREDICTED: protein PAXX [Condylura cristata]|uniref:protein PAXX n=1 Tax=Condylura cristata TaxID=143302 RepID=UPI000334384D|nr:PREDICTED: protein PAXX [Condylura cristata]
MGMASDDEGFQGAKDDMKMPVVSVSPAASGDLAVKLGSVSGVTHESLGEATRLTEDRQALATPASSRAATGGAAPKPLPSRAHVQLDPGPRPPPGASWEDLRDPHLPPALVVTAPHPTFHRSPPTVLRRCWRRQSAAGTKARHGLSVAEDLTPRFRAACERQAVTVTLQEGSASLTLSEGAQALDVPLSKVPASRAASRLQALTLGLAARVCDLERRLAAAEETAASPRKKPRPAGPQLFLPDPDAQRGGPGAGVRRRCPGESLINPGFKSKKPAAGVNFDDS